VIEGLNRLVASSRAATGEVADLHFRLGI
jgi:hypothetical protein